jgi:phosphoribosyl-dephospho-CoA transferase
VSAWGYCEKCDSPFQREDFSVRDVVTEEYECPACGTQNDVCGYGMTELLTDMMDRISELEAKLKEVQGKI